MGRECCRQKPQGLLYQIRVYACLYVLWDEESFKAHSCFQRTSKQVTDKEKQEIVREQGEGALSLAQHSHKTVKLGITESQEGSGVIVGLG